MDLAVYETTVPTVVVADAGTAGAWVERELDDATVEVVETESAALALLESRTVDCLVVGEELADVTGPDLAGAARELSSDLPIVCAPATGTAEGARAATAAGATDYLPRDLAAPGELSALVEDAVAAHDRDRQRARERDMFRELLERAPLAIYFKDDEARHVAVSSMAEEAADERAIGKTDRELFGSGGDGRSEGDDAGADTEADDTEVESESYRDDLAVLESGESVDDREERVELEGGEELWLRTSKLPRRTEDGDVVGLLGITRDVTAEKRRERELRRETRRLEQFASFASHDLRNPVTIARGYVQRARETGDLAPLSEVVAELDRMEQLIDDLLHIARPDERREEEWTDLATVVERSWAAVDAPEADLTVAVPDDVQLRAASGALRQLLENVLANAVEHGGPSVSVEVGLTTTGFYVADDGPGIPPDERDRIFEYGYTTGGTGVGLAIAAEIAEAHGWVPGATGSDDGGARLEFDRCLLRATGAPAPVEGDAVDLGRWTTVGDLAVEGDATCEAPGRWTVRGGGEALWGGIESYALCHVDVDGDVRVEGRVTGVERVHDYSKAGLLVTDAAGPDRPLAFVGKTAGHGTEAAWRTDPGSAVDTDQAEPDAALPRWYRIDRLGDRVTLYGAADGEDWRMIDQHVLPLQERVRVGLAVCSHDVGTLCESSFEDVRVVALDRPDGSNEPRNASEARSDGPDECGVGPDPARDDSESRLDSPAIPGTALVDRRGDTESRESGS